MEDKIVAKKHIETKREGEYEITKYHIIEITDFDKKLFNHIIDDTYVLDDGEGSYYAGVPMSIDGEVAYIEVHNFMAFLEEKIEEYKEEQDEFDCRFAEQMQEMYDYLEKYIEYTIWGDF